MTTDVIYHYDRVTRLLLGQGKADECPMRPGVFPPPAFATAVIPIPAGDVPEGSGQAFDEADQAWVLVDLAVASDTTTPPAELTEFQRQQLLRAAVQAHLDSRAQALGYDSIYTAATYADEPAVPKFQAEGQNLRAWRSLVWSYCYAVLAEVSAGARPIPTAAELIAGLPEFGQ